MLTLFQLGSEIRLDFGFLDGESLTFSHVCDVKCA